MQQLSKTLPKLAADNKQKLQLQLFPAAKFPVTKHDLGKTCGANGGLTQDHKPCGQTGNFLYKSTGRCHNHPIEKHEPTVGNVFEIYVDAPVKVTSGLYKDQTAAVVSIAEKTCKLRLCDGTLTGNIKKDILHVPVERTAAEQ